MELSYNPTVNLTVNVALGEDERYIDGGLQITALKLSDRAILVTGHLVLGDGTVHPKAKDKIVYPAGYSELPEWVQALHEEFLILLAECASMVQIYIDKGGS